MSENLFNHQESLRLAEKLRPLGWDDFVGQEHIVGPGKTLRVLVEKDKISSLIFYGPPGTGKTTLARIISQISKARFIDLNATESNVKEVRQVCHQASSERSYGRRTILFIDEVHRFNKAQQDVLLPFVEKGDVIFIGATTFNPFFYITPALNSRTLLFEFKKLSSENLAQLLTRIIDGLSLALEPEASEFLVQVAGGDARILINRLEILSALGRDEAYTKEDLKDIFQTTTFAYERSDDHYDVISAFIKSVRGSAPDAALYYLAVMLEGGEDPRFIARRLAILAAEDIGLAEPGALAVIAGGYDLVEKIGLPEAQLILSEMTLYLSALPKSNSATLAIGSAREYVRNNPQIKIPPYLKDAHYSGAKKLERGLGYRYPHDFPGHYVEQAYLESPLRFYNPGQLGKERALGEYLQKLGEKKGELGS